MPTLALQLAAFEPVNLPWARKAYDFLCDQKRIKLPLTVKVQWLGSEILTDGHL